MKTEQQIVYDLLNIVHGGEVSNDNVYSDRLIRSFLRTHRASKMNTFYHKGLSVNDIVFQDLGTLELKKSGNDYSVETPAFINFENNQGVYVTKFGYNIPIMDSEAFDLSKMNFYNNSKPKAKFEYNKLIVFAGCIDECNFLESSLKTKAVKQFVKEYNETDDEPHIFVNVRAVLYDPGDQPGYDWTKDPYPCPSEIIDKIETSTLSRNLDLMIRMKGDQVGNAMSDK